MNLFQLCHGVKGVLSPLDGDKYASDKELLTTLEKLGLDSSKFFHVSGCLYSYCYNNGFVRLEMYGVDEEYFKDFNVIDSINEREKYISNALESNDFDSVLSIVAKPLRFDAYKALFDRIPEEDRFDTFIWIYTTSEYGFSDLDKDFLKTVFKYRKEKPKLPKSCGSEVTIYRGVCSKSTPAEDALSWTLDKGVAHYYACRFGSGKVYRGKIKKSDILWHIEHEDEVLVKPSRVKITGVENGDKSKMKL